MLWLIWHMWILIALAFFGGVIAGWVIRARSDETPERPLLETLDATAVVPANQAAAPPAKPEPGAEADAEPEPEPEPKSEPKSEPEGVAEPAPEPETVVAEAPSSSAEEAQAVKADDLTAIKGLGPKAAEKLNAEGVTRFDQIAAWTAADIARFDALINGRGRIVRDDWVTQAKALAAG